MSDRTEDDSDFFQDALTGEPEDSPLQKRFRLLAEQQRAQSAQDVLVGRKTYVLETGYCFPDAKKFRSHAVDPYESVRRLADPVALCQPVCVREAAQSLQADFPHAQSAIETLLASDQMRMAFGSPAPFQPVLLVGPPGCGKSTLARACHEALGYPTLMMNVGAMPDPLSFTGTHQTFGDAKPSVILEFMARTETANPCIILDEIDKSPEGGRHGSVKDVLLQFLEPREAATFRDMFLNATANLSHVRWVLTANNLDRVPWALRSRCRIITVSHPAREHVPHLSRKILRDVLKDMRLDPRWFTLDGLEEAVLQDNFRGDMRHLKMMVDVILREKIISQTVM